MVTIAVHIAHMGCFQLEQIFEVAATKNKLKEDEKALSRGIEAYAAQEVHFIKSATQFSHPIYVLSQAK
jgi:hypothetical protein